MDKADALVVVAYYEATYRIRDGLTPTEKSVWLGAMAEVEDKDDALRAIERIARSAEFPPTAMRVAEVAGECRIERIVAEREGRELEAPPDTRPVCCQEAIHDFDHWLETHATDEERETADRLGLGKTLQESS